MKMSGRSAGDDGSAELTAIDPPAADRARRMDASSISTARAAVLLQY